VRTTKTPPSPCPECKDVQYGASHKDNAVPEPGDYSLCFNCGALLRFDEDLKLVAVSDADPNELSVEDHAFMRSAQDRIKQRGRIR
jgi:hypothetical protein